MKLEERLNKKLKDIDFKDITTLGESIAEIDESEIRKWTMIDGNNVPDMFVHYKYNCLRYKVRKLVQEFFKVNKKFNRQELQKLLDLEGVFETKKLLVMLLENGYILEIEKGVYIVEKVDENYLIELIVSIVWNSGADSLKYQREQLEKVLKTQLKCKYIKDERFLKDVMRLFGPYSEDLLKMSLDEKTEFFKVHMCNISRGYILRLMLLKFIYRDMIENMDYNVDGEWVLGYKNSYFNWKGEDELYYI